MNTRSYDNCPGRLGTCRGTAIRVAALRWVRAQAHSGFTLLELLVVIAIMGIVASVSLPAIKTWNRSNITSAASRQLLDDLALARQRAISSRSTVYVLFFPPAPWQPWFGKSPFIAWPPWEYQLSTLTNLLASQYANYALYMKRQVGDQPGTGDDGNPKYQQYVTPWRTLPEGTYIAPEKYSVSKVPLRLTAFPLDHLDPRQVWTFSRASFFVPSSPSTNNNNVFQVPYIAFNYLGNLVDDRAVPEPYDAVIPLVRGSVTPARGVTGRLIDAAPTVTESPSGNSTSTNQYCYVVVDRLTGRARVQKQEVQ